ncbi:FkbM family methyltransferase [Azospirillum halopraeferens]|uniref:FkbM family methyltransferase n=1 Tax=Azospirillum halopraeferens TaxID=34010 RepID=UPI000421D2E7|nr:FkbM family methyltransferase [Azospirillum halopraeferens]
MDVGEVMRKARKLFRLMPERTFRQGLRRGVAAVVEMDPLLNGLRPAAVIDVGANVGQFTLLARTRFPDAIIHAFEPLDGAAAVFERLFGADPWVHLHKIAAGAVPGETVLHVSGRPDCSSLLPIGAEQQRAAPGSAAVARIPVVVRPLDSLPDLADLPRPILMKVDVQGAELDVLSGAAGLLGRIDHLIVEASFTPLYDGQALADEVLARLRDAGFRLAGVNRPWFGPDGRCLQADFRFDRTVPATGRPPGAS